MRKFKWKTNKQIIGKGKKKFIVITVVLCLVVAAAGGAVNKKNKSSAEEKSVISATVDTGTIRDGISGTGTISYADTTDVLVPSDLEINEVLVSEGTYVSKDELLATVDEKSLAVCIADVKEAISDLDSTITSKHSSSTTQYIKSGVSGTVEKIYGKEGDNVEDVMVEYGALMLVKNGDESIKVIGSDGVIDSVNVSEGGTVSASTKVMTLESDAQSGDYVAAVKEREELVSVLETLIAIKKNGGITASIDGMVESVNVASSSSSVSSDSAENTAEKTVSDNGSGEKLTADNNSDDGSVHNIEAVKITNLSSTGVTEQGTVTADTQSVGTEASTDSQDGTSNVSDKVQVLNTLKVEPGKIIGTTKDMEYSDKEAATTTETSTETSNDTNTTATTGEDSNYNKKDSVDITSQGKSSADNGLNVTGFSAKSSGGSSVKSISVGGSSISTSSSTTSSSSSVSTVSAFTIANGDKMVVTMNVDELDILSILEGLSAEITLDAVENKTFEGTITSVSGNASSGNGTAQYPVTVTFDKTEEMLSGMNASVSVIINEAKDVLTIPLAAVTDEGRTSYVYTSYNESTGEFSGKTEVTLGMSDENNVEVTSGLNEGDTIYYEMQGSDSSDSGFGKGMPEMPGGFKMNGDMPSFDKSGDRPSFDGSKMQSGGDFPSGGKMPN